MRFRTTQKPRGILSFSDQRRLSLVIGCIGLVLIGFTLVRRPAFWSWMFPEEDQELAEADADTETAEQIPLLQHDEFVVNDHAALKPALDENTVQEENAVLTLPNDLRKTIRDDMFGIGRQEIVAYQTSLQLANKLEQAKDKRVGRGAFALFIDSPQSTRGIPWRMKGLLRQLTRKTENRMNIGTLYDAWISTPDSGDRLVHVVCRTASEALVAQVKASQEGSVRFGSNPPQVEFTGYFFKREAYASQGTNQISKAPLLIASTLHQHIPAVAGSTRSERLNPYLAWLAVVVCIGVSVLITVFWTSDRKNAQTRSHQLTKLPASPSFEDLHVVTVSEALQTMQAESEEAADGMV